MTTPQASVEQISVELISVKDELSGVRRLCNQMVEKYWPSDDKEEALVSLQLAANEAVANVTEHGYENEAGRPIHCTGTSFAGRIELEILHQGRAFNPPAEAPQIVAPLEGGMGLYLIEETVDEVSYCQSGDWQCIRLVKYFR